MTEEKGTGGTDPEKQAKIEKRLGNDRAICQKCNARNPPEADKCRKCSGTLRPKATDFRGKGTSRSD